jgi:DNA-binding IclR family transcriptional regulator
MRANDEIEIEDGDRYRAPALDKGLDILELLAATDEPLSQAEMAKSLGRTPNEIYRMLDRLVRRDYVRRTPGDRYEITLKLFELAHRHSPTRRLVQQAMPILRDFALKSEQACHLVIRDRNILVVVAQVDGPGYWNVSIRVGSRIGLVNTGSGHVFLAFADPEERRLMIEEQTSGENVISPALEGRLQTVRKQGFEEMPSAQTAGVTNLSVPIIGPMGTVMAVVTCPYTKRLDKADAPNMVDVLAQLRQAVSAISRRTGTSG